TPTPTPTASPSPSATAIPITKDGNLEVIVGIQGAKRLLSISGQLVSIRLEGVNADGTSGVITAETVYNGQSILFQALLPDAGLIDDRGGRYLSISPKIFSLTSPTPPVYVQCNVAFQLEPSNTHRCLLLILKNTL
ncbi:MAG: hypothetical protein WAV56_03470, partial [Microgenomates group bacterium]